MPILVVRHEPESCRFSVVRIGTSTIKESPNVEVADPLARLLGGTQIKLGDELRWYLERYLDYPFGPNEERAQRTIDALRAWGAEAFNALFAGQARDFYSKAVERGHTELQIVIASDDPAVLAWPWEALRDPLVGDLAQLCRIERQLNNVADPLPLSHDSTASGTRILLVTARPYEEDVAYRSISRPLVEMVHVRRLPVEITILRPPTFAQLRLELQTNPGAYQIVHFDGHGAFGGSSDAAVSAHSLRGPRGQLVFEKDDGSADPVWGEQLSHLLREHRIPIMVLNACQSGMQSAEADDAFASVATSLLRAGVRSVVAMGYSLYVSAAREFLPAFYARLFDSGSVAEATRAARQALLVNPMRLSARGPYPLQDWLVPVLYQQQPLLLQFASKAKASDLEIEPIPEDAKLSAREAPYGLIGRDYAVLALERALRRPQAGLLVHGLGGMGKTTLMRGFIEWLSETGGVQGGVVWLSFTNIRTSDYVINRLVEATFGAEAMAATYDEKLATLVRTLRDKPRLIVWDNFESISGAAEGHADSPMEPRDRERLRELLEQLRGGQTKVLITSRGDESWLGPTACGRMALTGLRGEESWALAEAVLADLGIKIDRNDEATVKLLRTLEGHPLMMRAVLPRLKAQSASSVLAAIEEYSPEAQSTDPIERKLFATLRFVEEGLSEEFQQLLYPLGLHESFVDADYLEWMADSAHQPCDATLIAQCLQHLEIGGLVQGRGNKVFAVHPALGRYLRVRAVRLAVDDRVATAWQRAFVDVLADQTDQVVRVHMKEQQTFFSLFGGSVVRARAIAETLDMKAAYASLTQALARYAFQRFDLHAAKQLYEVFSRHCELHEAEGQRVAPYHQLGLVAEFQRDFVAAESWYCKALDVAERVGDEVRSAGTYHQRGNIARARYDLPSAELWYRKAVELFERLGDEQHAAAGYSQLGVIAHMQRDLGAAEAWWRRSLDIAERLGDADGVATEYHHLGMLTEERRDFPTAEQLFSRSLEIRKRLGDDRGAALTYHALGNMAVILGDLAKAESCYVKSVEIYERSGDEHRAAETYHQLGVVAYDRGDFVTARAWYLKSVTIDERLGDMPGASMGYHELGMVARRLNDFSAAEAWYRKSLEITERIGDSYNASRTFDELGLTYQARGDMSAAENFFRKALEVKRRLGDQHGEAKTHRFLGLLKAQCAPIEAVECLLRAIEILSPLNDERLLVLSVQDMRRIHASTGPEERARIETLWSIAKDRQFPGV